MKIITNEVEAKLSSLNSIEEKQRYIAEQKRQIEKKIIEFKAFDMQDLKTLKVSTKEDFEAYQNEAFAGTPIYWHEGSRHEHLNEQQAKQAGIKNHFLLRKRLGLENTYKLLKADLEIWKLLEAGLKETAPPQPELSLKQVALLYIYNGYQINNENHNGIAKEHGHKSGHKLKQHYDNYYQPNSRKSNSRRKDKALAGDIEKVIDHLPKDKQEVPKTEAKFLRKALQNDDYVI